MAYLDINFFSQLGRGYDSDEPVFTGECSQDRYSSTSVAASFQVTATATVTAATKYIQILTDVRLRVYHGPASATDAVKQARAVSVAPGVTAIAAKAGNPIHVWAA